MSTIASPSFTIQTDPSPVPSVPSWFGEMAALNKRSGMVWTNRFYHRAHPRSDHVD